MLGGINSLMSGVVDRGTSLISRIFGRTPMFRPSEPFNSGRLRVSDLHTIYYQETGNPKGKPVVVLHGGPGAGIIPATIRVHDPKVYRIVAFDQRGCGRSTPYGELRENTTWDLVKDIERIREHLKIEKWQVAGGSWGSTLALAYAQTHPDRVTEIILRGVFTVRKEEIDWFYEAGRAQSIFPDKFEAYQAPIPPEERGNMLEAYYKRLTGPDKEEQMRCAKAWTLWEAGTLSLLPDPERVSHWGTEEYALAFACIECHYFINSAFFEPHDRLLRNAHILNGIPGVIVQGRYDICTPYITAWELSKKWTTAKLVTIEDAGHASTEPGIVKALVQASEDMAKPLQG